MGKVMAERIIEAPVEAVWRCLNDIDRTPEWVVGLEAAEIVTEGPFGVGTLYVDHNRLGPFPQVTPWRITEFEPMTRQTHVSESAALPSTISFLLAPTAVGTYVQMQVEFQVLPSTGVVGRALDTLLMSRMLKQVIAQNLDRLNAHLIGQAEAVAPAMA
ncbi:MAG: SRPBCC family protein [Anaerolineae bacterium]|nr:SRPBCC family protein [Anaerolineae bacterium]